MIDYLVPTYNKFAWQDTVKDKDLTAPPAASKGDRYIVATGGSGAWNTHDGDITYYDGANWQFIIKKAGMEVYVVDETAYYGYVASWVKIGTPADIASAVTLKHTQNTDTQLDSGVLAIDGSDNLVLTQNSVVSFKSENTGAIVNTLYLKTGKVGIGVATPNALLHLFKSAGSLQNVGDENSLLQLGSNTYDNTWGGQFEFRERRFSSVGSGGHALALYGKTAANSNLAADTFLMIIQADGNVGIGTVTPTSKLHVQVANTINKQALLIEQLDTTNNPTCAEINNDGTNHGLYIHQDGVLAASKYGLYVYSSTAQVNSSLVTFVQDNASSTKPALEVFGPAAPATRIIRTDPSATSGGRTVIALQHRTGADMLDGLGVILTFEIRDNSNVDNVIGIIHIERDGADNSGKMYLSTYNAGVRLNNMALTKEGCVGIGTDSPAGKLEVISPDYPVGQFVRTTADTNGNRGVLVIQHRTTADMVDGFGCQITFTIRDVSAVDNIICDIYGSRDGADNSGKMFLRTYIAGVSNNNMTLTKEGYVGIGTDTPSTRLHVNVAATKNVQALLIEQLDTTNNPQCAEINNDGTNHGLYIHQDGVLAASKWALYVYSNAVQVNTPLIYFVQDNASSTQSVLKIQNDGSGYDIEDGSVFAVKTNTIVGNCFTNTNPTNLITNGDFELWSAGASAAPDGWIYNGAGGNVARESTIVKIGTYSTKLTRGGVDSQIYNDTFVNIKGLVYWRGRTITFGCWVYATVANRACLRIYDPESGVVYSPYHTGNSTWQWLNVSSTINISASSVSLSCFVSTGDTSAYFDGAMLLEGSCAFAFADKPVDSSGFIYTDKTNGRLGVGVASPTARLHVQSASATNQQTLLIEQLDTTNNPICAEINNDGTKHALYIHQDGVLAANKYGLYVYSNSAQVNAPLAYFQQDNASSTSGVVTINNDGTGIGLTIIQNGNASYGVYFQFNNTYFGQYIDQVGILGTDYHALYVYSNAVQTSGNTELVKIKQDNASSTYGALTTINDGTGIGVLIIQNGNGTAVEIDNDGTNHGLYIHQDGVLAVNQRGLFVYSNTAQTNSNTCMIWAEQHNASTNREVVVIENYGTGVALFIEQYGNGIAQEINNDGTNHALYIHQDGVLAANKYGLYVYSNSAQVNAPLVNFVQDNASSDKDLLVLQQDGTGASLYIDHNGAISDAVAGIRIDGCDVANGSNAVVVSSVGPAGIGTSGISRWLLVDISGTRYYIPMWT